MNQWCVNFCPVTGTVWITFLGVGQKGTGMVLDYHTTRQSAEKSLADQVRWGCHERKGA
jgi:hypothetical protein